MSIRQLVMLITTIAMVTPAIAAAQDHGVPTAALSASSKSLYRIAHDYVIRAAEKMPEENYSFKPSPDVRTFGQILGHIADAQYFICSSAMSEKPPAADIEKTKSSKADLVKALKESVAYCGRAHEVASGPKGTDIIDGPGGKHPRAGVLYFNTAHTFEHYGNLVTYLRIKGIVPPSSEPRKPSSNQ